MTFFKKLKSLIATDKEIREALQKQNQERAALDERLRKISVATLDGEWDWFLKSNKIDSECAIEIIKECKLEEDDD